MSKPAKRSKSSDIKGGPVGGGKWDQVLSSSPFDEETWKPSVTWIVGRQIEDLKHIDALNIIVQTGLRKLFSVVTKDQLYTDVRDLGNTKIKKVKEIPANSEICEACKLHLDAGEPIPVPLLAKLIKWKFLAIKSADIRRRELEAKAVKAKAISDKKKGKDQKDSSKERVKSPKKGGKKTPEPQHAKDGSNMRKRGDEDTENKFIDDEPEDGAQYFILVSGFHDPRLFKYLAEIGVNVDSIITVSSQNYTYLKNPAADPGDNAAPAELTEEELNEEEQKKELKVFWKDVLPLLQCLPDSSKLHDIARLDYEVKGLMVPVDPNDAEQKVQYSTGLFEDIAVMVYNLLDARRLYSTFMENLKLVNVPVYGHEEQIEGSPVPPPTPNAQKMEIQGATGQDLGTEGSAGSDKIAVPPVDMRYYTDLMNTVPHESVSVPIVMHCMLEQITAIEEGTDPPSEQVPAAGSDGLNFNIASYLSDVAFKLGLSEKDHQLLSDVLELPSPPPEEPSPPELINIQDGISIRTQHLRPHYGFDPSAVERAMLQFLPFSKLCQLQSPTSAESRQRAARLQELIHFCSTDDLSKSEIDRAFKQFVFESIDLATTDPNGFILEKEKEGLQHTAIPWDDPYPFFKILIPTERVPDQIPAGFSTPSPSERSVNSGNADFADTAQSVQVNVAGHQRKGKGACTPEPVLTDRETDNPIHKLSKQMSNESKKGILLSSTRYSVDSSPRQSRTNSVHWTMHNGEESEDDIQNMDEMEYPSMDANLMEVVEAQQRNLDQWCFAEHFNPHILAQILHEASYHLPFLETYQHKRDETMMLILHNPYSFELQNHVDWHKELHSNTGFRNYLEFTGESITEWLKEKEAEYQAQVLSKEVESIRKEEEEKVKSLENAEPKGGKRPLRKSASRSKSPCGSRSSSQERVSSAVTNPYIRQGSLKAWQAEHDKLTAEEEEKERAKLEKRTKSAQKLKEKDEKEKPEKSKSPHGSAKSRQSRVDQDAAMLTSQSQDGVDLSQEPVVQEKFWPFSGYNTGNQLIHVSGITTTLFPSDGGRIKTERTEFVQGTTSIQSVIQKDDHIFSIHVINPCEDMGLPEDYEAELRQMVDGSRTDRSNFTADKSETEKSEKEDTEKDDSGEKEKVEEEDPEPCMRKPAVSQFGSVTAQLSDGMILALSQFGPSGESYLKPYEPEVYIPPTPMVTPSLVQPSTSSPAKGKKDVGKKGQPTPEPDKSSLVEEFVEEETKDEEEPVPKQEFQELFVTCPDGLSIKYFLLSSIGVMPPSKDKRQLAVRQSHPFKTKGVQNCESARLRYVQTELSRVVTADGTVVKTMVDGSIEVLSADGTVSLFTGQWVTPSSRMSSPSRSVKSEERDTPTKKGRKISSTKTQKPAQVEAEIDEEVKLIPPSGKWVFTYPSGERMQMIKDSKDCEELVPVPICVATDPETHQTMATRDDNVITISYPDGTTIVEHADGTRITIYYRESAVPSAETNATPDLEIGESDTTDVKTQTLKFVKVECPAFATVEFNTSSSENLTVFGSGTSINVFPDGYYILHHSNGGRVEVDTEGTLVYFPRRSRFLEHLMPERELQYVMRHNADVIVETVDPDGNIFNVRSTGDFHIIPIHGDDIASDDSNDDIQKDKKVTNYGQHAPRFFIIHADGSGTELLRYQDVAEYLMLSEQNPATAVMKDPLVEHPGVTGITILKPYISGVSEKWFKHYDQDSIIPRGIRCRDLKTLPPREYKTPGPQFGTNVGQGLSIGAATKGPTRIPILKCPSKLEIRQLVQYKPVSKQLREKLCRCLRDYAEMAVGRMHAESLVTIGDPRPEDEKILAEDLNSLAMAQRPQTKDCEPEHVKAIYEKAVTPLPPIPPPTPQPKRTLADWERDRREFEEEKDAKDKIKRKVIEPYFDSELGKTFLLTQAGDMDEMMRQLADDPRQNGTEAVRGMINSRFMHTQSTGYTQSQRVASVMSDTSTTSGSPAANVNGVVTVTPSSGLRPHNPTPAHATGQGSPSPLRPKNPTPAHGRKVCTDRPGNPTPKIALGVETPSEYEPSIPRGEYPMILEHPWEENDTEAKSDELKNHKPLITNVVGEPRSESVPLPTSIMGGRSGALPNFRFKDIEEPVRRQVHTSIIAGSTQKARQQLGMMRGLICQPEGVNFGVLKEGCTYAYMLKLRNTGVDSCRFKVRQPPPATGLRVIYKSGPVAAGMSVDLSLELYAIANGVEGESGVGRMGHILEIVTETDIFEVPVVATILTAHEYNNLNLPMGKETGVHLVSTHPPASSGIIRPRREHRLSNPS